MRYCYKVCSLISLCLMTSTADASIMLVNDRWSVAIEPETLAITVEKLPGTTAIASTGGKAHKVSELTVTDYNASWKWNAGQYLVSTSLDGEDLGITISAASPSSIEVLNQPQRTWGKGLIFPLAEGAYVQTGNSVWNAFLTERYSEFNTSQDISMPFWGSDLAQFSLTWIFTNPYNNKAQFKLNDDELNLSLVHEFSTLDFRKPFTMMLHLGGTDPLDGAKRYKQWLITEDSYESLSDKIARVPESEKLIGATHTYLWGSGLIATKDVTNWGQFVKTLNNRTGFANEVRRSFDHEAKSILKGLQTRPNRYEQKVLVSAFNSSLDALARQSWQNDKPDLNVLTHRYSDLRNEVAKTFSTALQKDQTSWGGGVSIATMNKLQKSKLARLWIGLGEGWEGGLWHPEAISTAVANGYLIAPYDSYETALKPGDNPSWATAHMGTALYEVCAIGQKNGAYQAGFQQSGRYTLPDCVRPFMQTRIPAILSAAPFNSWFLDVYATGMVFDSYPPALTKTQSAFAAASNENMRWIGTNLKIPLGSEDGNSVTTDGVFFAHGMQTPVIGWGDTDMQKDQTSPYYLGRYFPEEQPETFFKSVPIKQPYHTVHFDPRSRLPLYQTVFHGSIITTHHWLFDSLKFNNARSENELIQLLYNVPPLYHISADTLTKRLPIMERQDAFFRPLHRRLATQSLQGFKWLSDDKQIQRTSFEDGTELVANFTTKSIQYGGFELAAQSIAAFLPEKKEPIIYKSQGR